MMLQQLTVGVVGCGGVGSSVAEQLLRLGVGHVVAVDPCAVDGDDLMRCYGTTQDDAARAIYRVDVVARLASALGRSEAVDAVIGDLDDPAVARRLAGADMVFACDLTLWQRTSLERLAARYLLPVIDCAAALDALGDRLDGVLEHLVSVPHDLRRNHDGGIANETAPRVQRNGSVSIGADRTIQPSNRTIPLDTIAAGVAVAAFLHAIGGGNGGVLHPSRPRLPRLVMPPINHGETESAA